MRKPKPTALDKFKSQLQRDKFIKLEIPANNLKILLEVKFKLKLKLTDKYTIEYESKPTKPNRK